MADGSYLKQMNRLSKIKVLIINDFCITLINHPKRRNLLELFEDRQSISSAIIAAQVPTENCIELIGAPTLTDAVLDRLVHNARKINLGKIHSSLTKSDTFGR